MVGRIIWTMVPCIFIFMAAIVIDGSYAQKEEKALKKELSDLHYKLFKAVQNQTNIMKVTYYSYLVLQKPFQ